MKGRTGSTIQYRYRAALWVLALGAAAGAAWWWL